MSGVSSVGSSGVNPYELLSRIASSGSTSQSTDSTAESSSLSPFDQFLSDFTAELEAQGVDTEALKGLQEEIQTAVSTALEQAEQSGDTSDLRQVVEDTVNETLEANGFDADELLQQMQTAFETVQAENGTMPPEGPGAQGIGPPPPPPPSGGSETDSSTSEGSSDSTESLLDALSTDETEDSSSADRWLLQLMRELSGTSSSSGESDTSSQVNAAFQSAMSGQDGVLGFLLDVET